MSCLVITKEVRKWFGFSIEGLKGSVMVEKINRDEIPLITFKITQLNIKIFCVEGRTRSSLLPLFSTSLIIKKKTEIERRLA